MRFILPVILAAAISSLAGCNFADEAGVRAVLHEAFNAAKRGDVEMALQQVEPNHATKKLLAALKETNESRYQEALADLGKITRDQLKDSTLRISSVEVDKDSAVIVCVIENESVSMESRINARKVEGKWLLVELPGISDQ